VPKAAAPGEPYDLLMPIQDMFKIKDRGYVATGQLTAGPICTGDRIWVSTANRELFFTIVEIQALSGKVERAELGEQVGILLAGDGASELQRGHVIRRVPKGVPTP
jgi:selenocysteine-specific translation elongation factor